MRNVTKATKKLIIGLGTGRCGTMSLAYLLDSQEDACITHERRPFSWYGDPIAVERAVLQMYKTPADIVGDCGMYYLPYVSYVTELWKEIANEESYFVCLKRGKEQTVRSFLRKTKGLNHWMHHKGDKCKYHHWDSMYPKYNVDNKGDALREYWREYYLEAARLSKINSKFNTFGIEALNKKEGQQSILDFVQIPTKKQIFYVGVRKNVIKGRIIS